jgi:hypothetical protein
MYYDHSLGRKDILKLVEYPARCCRLNNLGFKKLLHNHVFIDKI